MPVLCHPTGLNKEERALMVKTLILERLPEDNYVLLKYLAQFLAKVRFISGQALEENLTFIFVSRFKIEVI